MRVSELFESDKPKNNVNPKDIVHGDVVKTVYKNALALLKAPKAILDDAAFHMQHTDQFWDESIDEVTSNLKYYVKNAADIERYDDQAEHDLFVAYDNAVRDVINNIVDFYNDPMNHPPGYKSAKLKHVDDLEQSDKTIIKYFSEVPAFSFGAAYRAYKEAEVKDRADKSAARKLKSAALATPEYTVKLAADVDKFWDRAFGITVLKKIAKNPNHYELPKGSAPADAGELIAMLLRNKNRFVENSDVGELVSWVLNTVGKSSHALDDIVRDKKYMATVASKSAKLSELKKQGLIK